MKNILVVLSILLLFIISGCLKADYQGKWIRKNWRGSVVSEYIGLLLDSNGQYELLYDMSYNPQNDWASEDTNLMRYAPGWSQFPSRPLSGKYTVNGNILYLGESNNGFQRTLRFKVNGDTMTIQYPDGKEFTFQKLKAQDFPWITKTPPLDLP